MKSCLLLMTAAEEILPMRPPAAFDRETFAAACLLGLILGAVYDLLRSLRRGARLGGIAENILDFFFALLFFFCCFVLSVARTGSVRLFTLAAMLLGAAAERYTSGRLITAVFSQVFRGLRAVCELSVGRVFAKISQKIRTAFVKNKNKLRKLKK